MNEKKPRNKSKTINNNMEHWILLFWKHWMGTKWKLFFFFFFFFIWLCWSCSSGNLGAWILVICLHRWDLIEFKWKSERDIDIPRHEQIVVLTGSEKSNEKFLSQLRSIPILIQKHFGHLEFGWNDIFNL